MKTRVRIVVVALGLLAAGACKKKEDAGGGTGTGTGTAAVAVLDAAAAAPAIDAAEVAIDAAAAAATPLTDQLKLVGVGTAKPFELMVPAGTKHELSEATDETLPAATIKIGAFEIQVDSPESGFFDLEAEKGMTTRGDATTKFEREEQEADGFTLIYVQDKKTGKEWTAVVTRPKLDLSCAGYGLKSRADADLVIEICRTIKPTAS